MKNLRGGQGAKYQTNIGSAHEKRSETFNNQKRRRSR
jgi:hypothetical protein